MLSFRFGLVGGGAFFKDDLDHVWGCGFTTATFGEVFPENNIGGASTGGGGGGRSSRSAGGGGNSDSESEGGDGNSVVCSFAVGIIWEE